MTEIEFYERPQKIKSLDTSVVFWNGLHAFAYLELMLSLKAFREGKFLLQLCFLIDYHVLG